MRKGTITAARTIEEDFQRGGFRRRAIFLTLTYRNDDDWERSQIRDFLHRVRKWLSRRGIRMRYVWVAELTKRGRPHYHLVLWLPRGVMLPKPDRQGWWPHGMTNIQWARNAVGYLAKYASKGQADQLQYLPKGARISGVGGLSERGKKERRWWLAPKYVRERFPDFMSDVRPAVGGGYVARSTGEFLSSPYALSAVGGRFVCVVNLQQWKEENGYV